MNQLMVGDIVTQYPAAADVLKSYRIDFCCGGNRPLLDVVNEMGLSADAVLRDILAVIAQPVGVQEGLTDWTKLNYSELIDHIVKNHHEYLRRTLPELAQYTLTIRDVHGYLHPELAEVNRLFMTMRDELMLHLPKEELEMFPAIMKLDHHPTAVQVEQCKQLIEALEDEHEACGVILKQIRALTNDYEIPEDACPTYQITFHKLQELEADLFQHIHLENNILFPRVSQQIA
ncbi:MAG: iron-sulfur cluster repair di-iron protein [Candidatus Cohnella colombiensis]|uniref:Iron-sulfur cluster repair di-iron protein n=1 Tax=Candidatus Cohnella colombiensis TaxID=3121368 RepID=A0AA95EZT7_9BACL|nr:MAG: iron-sulfur cluster repair di-iron protein [Cohnella sp.]